MVLLLQRFVEERHTVVPLREDASLYTGSRAIRSRLAGLACCLASRRQVRSPVNGSHVGNGVRQRHSSPGWRKWPWSSRAYGAVEAHSLEARGISNCTDDNAMDEALSRAAWAVW